MNKLRIGLIINPVAGLGGSVALKGSDNMAQQAIALGAIPMANKRADLALEALAPFNHKVELYTVNGEMGEQACIRNHLPYQVIYRTHSDETSFEDSRAAAKAMMEAKVDIIVFAGGDGTARDICAVVEDASLVLGIPAGCKIHSGVYAVTPKAAGRILAMLAGGEMLSVMDADVMDIDEVAFRQGNVRARRFGEMQVPGELRYIQATKMGGRESDELVLQDIAEYVISQMDEENYYVMGSGSTVAHIMEELGLDNTLLGVDLIRDHQLMQGDMTAGQLLSLTDHCAPGAVKLVITVIGGQGHILGRGNQQLSPEFIRRIGKDNMIVVATKNKLKALEGRPLLVDTGDVELDRTLAGLIKVTTGYNDHVMYPVAGE